MLDWLYIDRPTSDHHASLLQWYHQNPDVKITSPDYHRLQLEHWIWDHRVDLIGRVMDIGAYDARRYLGPEYFTFGAAQEHQCEGVELKSDVVGDLLNLPYVNDLDAILCTEVLEHCENPFRAMECLHDALKPGGLLLVTSPFIWPDHHTHDYPDYWRFTRQAWDLLCEPFASVNIQPCAWTVEGNIFYNFLRRYEGMGYHGMVEATTGYLVEARKAS